MRRPPSGNKKSSTQDTPPPGGRALERIKQDRLARGLGDPTAGGSLHLDVEPSRRAGASKKRAPAKKAKTSTPARRR